MAPREPGNKKSAIPTELHIKVKTLAFNRPSDHMKQGVNEEEKHEPSKFFVLISFNGENFVTAKKVIDTATNSINFEQLSSQQNEIVINLSIAENKEKTVRFGVNVITSSKDKRSKLYGRGGAIEI